jgi:MFS family permease
VKSITREAPKLQTNVGVAQSSGIFRGWWVLGGIFLVMTIGSGFAFYAQGVFLDALVEEQGFSVSVTAAGTGTFFAVSGVSGYFTGGLISRFDIRKVMTAGAIVSGLGIFLMGQVRTVWQMFAVFVIFGGGYALAGLVPTTSLVTRLFHRRRSVALAIASTGLSMGAIAITPAIAQLIESNSLVDMAPKLAVAYLLGMIPITWLLLRPSPEALGLRPDGDAPTPESLAGVELPGTPFAEAVRSRYFAVLSLAFVLIMAAQVGALQHIFKLTKDRIDIDAAKLALAVVAGTSVLARIAGGLAAMRIPLKRLASIFVMVQAGGVAIIGVADGLAMILIGCVVLGTAMGNLLMLHPLLLAEAFGVRDYSRIYGLGALLMVFGVGLGPFIVGVLRDSFSYQTAFLAMAGFAFVGLAVLRAARKPVEPDRVSV